jgi:feruloyl-CoA synthase
LVTVLGLEIARRRVDAPKLNVGEREYTVGRCYIAAVRRTRAVRLSRSAVVVERCAGGVVHLRCADELGAYPRTITERLLHWAEVAPDRVLFAQRNGDGAGWRTIGYAEARARAQRIAAGLLARGLSAERPVVVLSGNDLEHALLELGALYAGVPYVPVSPAYALLSSDFARLRSIVELVTPGLVYAAQATDYAAAIAATVPRGRGMEVVSREGFDQLEQPVTAAVEDAHRAVGPDTIAKILFTSGSTGMPKAVINTQRMWCANQEMARSVLAFVQDVPPVMVDWAPWHHTAGGNKAFGLALYNGGSLYIDEGKPLPGAIEATARNLREVSPTVYFNVPRGYEALLPHLRDDAALRASFFRELSVLWFAGAGIAQHVFDEYKDLAYRTLGEEVPFLTGLGSTETAPFTMGRTWDTADAANMGLPAPGVDLKLVPFEDRYEARLKGPHIFPGYWRQPELTAQAFDDEGYYCLGDAFAFADPADPQQGLVYRGRLAEDFKLGTGTWVHVGPLRARLIAQLAPLVRDAVIVGEGKSEIGALLVLAQPDAPRDAIAQRIAAFNAGATGSSNRIARFAILDEPPSLDAGEVTDKGTLNQRAIARRRHAVVERLYA